MADVKEKILAEVERLMYAYNLEADIASAEDAIGEKVADGKRDVCKQIRDFINSLPEEPQRSIIDKLQELTDEALAKETKESWNEFLDEDLEKAAYDYCDKVNHRQTSMITDAFKEGAQWQMKQMVSGAFTCEIGKAEKIGKVTLRGNFAKCDDGDKVKVIIIKED